MGAEAGPPIAAVPQRKGSMNRREFLTTLEAAGGSLAGARYRQAKVRAGGKQHD